MLYPISTPIKDTAESLFGYIDERGEIVVASVFAGAKAFSEGLASVLNSEGKSGFIDGAGRLVIPHRFQGLGRFVDGLCSINGGYIDHGLNKLMGNMHPRFLKSRQYYCRFRIAASRFDRRHLENP